MLPQLICLSRFLCALTCFVLLILQPAVAQAPPGEKQDATIGHCFPSRQDAPGHFDCRYNFNREVWGDYPCGKGFIRDAARFCRAGSDMVFRGKEWGEDRSWCNVRFTIPEPRCVEDYVKKVMLCNEKQFELFNGPERVRVDSLTLKHEAVTNPFQRHILLKRIC